MSAGFLKLEALDRPELTFSLANFPGEPIFRKLQAELGQIARLVWAQMEELSLRLMDCPEVDDFCLLRKRFFPKYSKLSLAMSSIVLSSMEDKERAGLVLESLQAMEGRFTADGPLYLGEEAVREALFSIGTLKRAYRLTPRLLSTQAALPSEKAVEDKDLAAKFSWYVLWSQLHFDCLRAALERKQPIKPEILGELLEGLRTSLQAYGCVRQALELRGSLESRYEAPAQASWDSEDEALSRF